MVRSTDVRTCWVWAPCALRLPPQTLRMTTAGRIACSARQLVASMAGSPRKVKSADASVGQMGRKALDGGNGRSRGGEEVQHLFEQAAARACKPVRGEFAGRVAIAQRERLLEPLLDARGKRAAGIIDLEQPATGARDARGTSDDRRARSGGMARGCPGRCLQL